MHKLFVRIPERYWDALKVEADAEGEDVAEIVRQAIAARVGIPHEYIERWPKNSSENSSKTAPKPIDTLAR